MVLYRTIKKENRNKKMNINNIQLFILIILYVLVGIIIGISITLQ